MFGPKFQNLTVSQPLIMVDFGETKRIAIDTAKLIGDKLKVVTSVCPIMVDDTYSQYGDFVSTSSITWTPDAYNNQIRATVTGLQSTPILNSDPTTAGQFLGYSPAYGWAPFSLSNTTSALWTASGFGLTQSLTVRGLKSTSVSSTAPTNGQFLACVSGTWTPTRTITANVAGTVPLTISTAASPSASALVLQENGSNRITVEPSTASATSSAWHIRFSTNNMRIGHAASQIIFANGTASTYCLFDIGTVSSKLSCSQDFLGIVSNNHIFLTPNKSGQGYVGIGRDQEVTGTTSGVLTIFAENESNPALSVTDKTGDNTRFYVAGDGKINTNQIVTASSVSTVVGAMRIYDDVGVAKGWIPIYSTKS